MNQKRADESVARPEEYRVKAARRSSREHDKTAWLKSPSDRQRLSDVLRQPRADSLTFK